MVPQQADVSPHNAFGAARNHYALELAVNRDDPALAMAYDRANGPMNSSVQLGSEWRQYHGGDTVIASSADARLAIGAGCGAVVFRRLGCRACPECRHVTTLAAL